LVGDITEYDFTSLKQLRKDTGPIGNGSHFGYECFNLLGVAAENRCVIGLVNQKLFRRRTRKLTRSQIRRLPLSKRQSGLWTLASQQIPPAPRDARWVWVFDREGDINEALQALSSGGRSYLIRSRTNRRVLLGHDSQAKEGKLHTFIRSLPVAGTRDVPVAASGKRAARVANCGVSFAPVQLVGSKANGSKNGVLLKAWVVRVWELQQVHGEEPLEWLLLTNVPVESLSDASERIDWYECRWEVEEYHKALKSGVKIEEPQLQKGERLEPLLALLAVVALELLRLRDASREESSAHRPAVEWVDPVLVEVLDRAVPATASKSQSAHPSIETRVPSKPEWEAMSVREFYQRLAKLGGHLGSFQTRPPGWQILWHGYRELITLAQGVRLSRDTT
jgi:hypothetical protein